MPQFRIIPERSKVWIEATSSVHPIHGESEGLSGSITAEFDGDGLDLSSTPAISVELPVERLKSGNRLEDAEMMRRIDARRYPTIRGVVRDMKSQSVDGQYVVTGELTFHGVTQTMEGEVRVSRPDDRTLVIEGEHTFDVRDFKVEPPKILMLKVHPEVKVRIRVEAVGET
ncbi:MAG TPA: YceI family protein [Acidimicrobiia bacterium]|nr:YceI family protein [Acidimicrobiia bacterium]